jgi:thiol-disulfide isomerase/thioredoxin
MSSRRPVGAGLFSGAAVAGVLLVVLVLGLPGPSGVAPTATEPSTGDASRQPTGTPVATGGATASRAPAGSAAASGAAGSASPQAGAAFHVGEAAPDLVVPQVGGGQIDLASLRGKPVWVNFMATWCPPCVDEFPVMNGFAARYADEGLVVLAIDVREDEGTVASFAESLGASFPIGLDEDGSAQDAWDATALPVHFWVDAQGVIRQGAVGGIGPDGMARGLSAILPGVDVTP